MKEYKATFNGRKTGDIGITYPIVTWVHGISITDAELNLLDKYEHITHLSLIFSHYL